MKTVCEHASGMTTGIGPCLELGLFALAFTLALIEQPCGGIPLNRAARQLVQRRLEFRIACVGG